MTPLSLQLALHGSIVLLLGFIGGIFFARAIKRGRGEVAWRVVHAGAHSAGATLLAIAIPSQWVALSGALKVAMTIGLVGGVYFLCAGMYIAAIGNARGIPGGGPALNRLVSGLYAIGTVIIMLGGVLLTIGLLGTALSPSAAELVVSRH